MIFYRATHMHHGLCRGKMFVCMPVCHTAVFCLNGYILKVFSPSGSPTIIIAIASEALKLEFGQGRDGIAWYNSTPSVVWGHRQFGLGSRRCTLDSDHAKCQVFTYLHCVTGSLLLFGFGSGVFELKVGNL